MNKKELISIIVPVYNVEEYLERCVKSILKQTYKQFEILLIDDGSTDDSAFLCDEVAKKDYRIKVFHKVNGGLSSARNYGLQQSTGKYVCFIDSDDYVSEYYLEKLKYALDETKSDISICRHVMGDDDYYSFPILGEIIPPIVYSETKLIMDNYFNRNCADFVISVNKLYKKELFDGITFPEKRYHEDEATTYKVLYRAKRVALINEGLYYYYQRPGSITNNSSFYHYDDAITSLIEVIDFYDANGEFKLKNKAVLRLFKMIKLIRVDLLSRKNDSSVIKYLDRIKEEELQFAEKYNYKQNMALLTVYYYLQILRHLKSA